MNKFRFKLYITGRSPRSESAIINLKKICGDYLKGQFELAIIDVLEQPALAEQERIIATPTLVKEFPPPFRRIIGDLSNPEQLMQSLGLYAAQMAAAGADSKENRNAI